MSLMPLEGLHMPMLYLFAYNMIPRLHLSGGGEKILKDVACAGQHHTLKK